jgi:hypothetical protein
MSWMDALKQFNAGRKWKIPAKGSDEYLAVMKLVAPKPPKLERTDSAPKVPKAPKAPKNIVEPIPIASEPVTAPKSRKKPVVAPVPAPVLVPEPVVLAPVEPVKKKVQRSKL